MNQRPAATGRSATEGRSYFRRLTTRQMRDGINGVRLKLRGGAECWVEIEARGGVLRVPGHMAIYDVMRILANAE